MRSASDIILKFVCPGLGAVIANFMFFAPFLDARRAVERGHLGDLNPTPWAFMIGNCLGWVTFLPIQGFILSIWLNMVATKLMFENHRSKDMRKSFTEFLQKESTRRLSVTSVEDCSSGQENERDSENPLQPAIDFGKIVWDVTSQTTPAPTSHENLVVGILTIWLAAISTVSFGHSLTAKTKNFIIGLLVNLNLIFFYGAPLSTIWHVTATRNAASIHVPTMVTNTANGAFWTAYGIAVSDPFIIVPNAMGACLGVVQVVLLMIFPRKTDQSKQQCDTVAIEKGCNDVPVETDSGRTSQSSFSAKSKEPLGADETTTEN